MLQCQIRCHAKEPCAGEIIHRDLIKMPPCPQKGFLTQFADDLLITDHTPKIPCHLTIIVQEKCLEALCLCHLCLGAALSTLRWLGGVLCEKVHPSYPRRRCTSFPLPKNHASVTPLSLRVCDISLDALTKYTSGDTPKGNIKGVARCVEREKSLRMLMGAQWQARRPV